MYLPKRVIIKRKSQGAPRTDEIVRRVKAFDPSIPIETLSTNDVDFPGKTAVDRWQYRKESLLISERTSPFITTFASPGNIVENLGTILNLEWQCVSNCEFCYLQSVMPFEHILHSNVERLEHEFRTEPFVHAAVLTLWTLISFDRKAPLLKLPHNFHYASDYLRGVFQVENVQNKKEAIELLRDLIWDKNEILFSRFEQKSGQLPFRKTGVRVSKKQIEDYFNKNSLYKPRLNASEFTDIIATDHLSGYMDCLMQLVAKYPDVELGLRTKSAYVDEMLKHDGMQRVRFAMGFNTESVINKYEHGTASLTERLQAAKRVQDRGGYGLRIVIEPIIFYPGCEQEYMDLVNTVMTTLDPNNIVEITIGTVRYKKSLVARVQRNFTSTDLFSPAQNLQPPEKDDRRFRYSVAERQTIYTKLISEFRKHTKAKIRLGAETDELWKLLGLDSTSHIGQSVHQYGSGGSTSTSADKHCE